MKIIVDENIPYIRGRFGAGCDITYVDQDDICPELVRDADALLVRTRTRCNASLLKGSKVKFVGTGTIGTDHLDLHWLEENGITAVNAPGCNAPGVAQYVWSALLRLGFKPDEDRLGVVGCGNIGHIVKAWGENLGAEVWVSDPPRQRAGLPGNYHTLDDIMSNCKAVTFHTPLTREGEDATYHLVSDRELNLMGKDRIFINAARGPVVDNEALLRKIKSDPTLRTAIDVWEGEPTINRELLDAVNYGTFHIAGYSRQGKERATRMLLEALEKHSGIKMDTSGLEPAYDLGTAVLPTPERILKSYDPADDTAPLRLQPEQFETLRHDYNYRPEA